ncbi:DUF6994 family protein [Homoserinibacter gongjuensis]|uniref:Uncharacterized protein n=1 Tax=Homoserinibacter gongjuensis TaxID=1162968 RepID=A0ABQ6JUH8_9MICO|nr:hypothetical protein [Homoserinibacter gongjuensis]GMA91950.1 hypothetical protein GCM10025869_24790 [Homoserinibacter gongjuensis]
MTPEYDPEFDFRADAGGGDPDSRSATLRRYHRLAWSKPLPDGTDFILSDGGSRGYLRRESEGRLFLLSSDTIHRTFARHLKMQHIVSALPADDREAALRRGYRMGGMILFPGVRIDRKHTINQARGVNRKLEDRFDLALECIRRFYDGQSNPLSEVLARYADFFALFGSFKGYVDFWLLQDLVSDDYSTVEFWADFDDFTGSPLPADLESYLDYRERMLSFVDARNARIAESVAARSSN